MGAPAATHSSTSSTGMAKRLPTFTPVRAPLAIASYMRFRPTAGWRWRTNETVRDAGTTRGTEGIEEVLMNPPQHLLALLF